MVFKEPVVFWKTNRFRFIELSSICFSHITLFFFGQFSHITLTIEISRQLYKLRHPQLCNLRVSLPSRWPKKKKLAVVIAELSRKLLASSLASPTSSSAPRIPRVVAGSICIMFLCLFDGFIIPKRELFPSYACHFICNYKKLAKILSTAASLPALISWGFLQSPAWTVALMWYYTLSQVITEFDHTYEIHQCNLIMDFHFAGKELYIWNTLVFRRNKKPGT